MALKRTTILSSLAGLTVIFLLGAAAYAHWGDDPPTLRESGPLKILINPRQPLPAALRLTVLETGIAAITATQLRATSLSYASLSPDDLQLTRNGQPVPFQGPEPPGRQ